MREAGKRQPRPNLSRSDFGYEERSRATAKAKKPKGRAEEGEEEMLSEAGVPRPPMRGEKDARNLTVDFTKLDMATLKRYKRHFRLKTRQNVTKTELSLAVARHFASQTGARARRRKRKRRPMLHRASCALLTSPFRAPACHAARSRRGRHHLAVHVLGSRR